MEYKIRKPQASDLFIVTKILGAIKFKNIIKSMNEDDDIRLARRNLTDENANQYGLLVVATLADSILENLDKVELDVYKFIAKLTNLGIEEIETMNIAEFAELVITIFKTPDFVDFIQVVLKSFN